MFDLLTSERNWHIQIPELNPASARRLKSEAKAGKVSEAKMEEILTKAGKIVLQVKLWKYE